MKKLEQSFSLVRPNFFPGQLVDYRDFNRLAQQSDHVVSYLCHHLFPGGGIVEGASHAFAVECLGGLKVLIKPGIALSPDGETIVLKEEQIVDLTSIKRCLSDVVPIFVSLKNETRGFDKAVDQEDSSIAGFRSEGLEAGLQCSVGKKPEETVEIFRVNLDKNCESLREATSSEEWLAELGPTENQGLIDLRFRKVIVPQTFAPLDTLDQVNLRLSLYGIEQALGKLARIYVIEDSHGTHQYLTQLHAEVLSRPFQPLKLGFIISEFSDRLSRFLNRLANHVGRTRSNFDLSILHEVVAELDHIKVKEVLPRQAPYARLERIAQGLSRLVEFAEQKFNLVHTVREALMDIEHQHFEFAPQIILGGHLFERSDLVAATDDDLVKLKGKSEFTREVSAKFSNGDALKGLGRFLKEGTIGVKIKITDPTRPVVLLLHEYVRRGGSQVKYEVNGKSVLSHINENASAINCWINRGVVVPAECLAPQGNELSLVIDHSDLDFGFFDVSVYTPTIFGSHKSGEC